MDRLTSMKRTDCSEQEFVEALIYAWNYIFAYVPTKKQLGIVWAQHALETGTSTSMYNYNIGTVEKSYALNEYWDVLRTNYFMLNEFSQTYLAFETLQEGAKFYLKFLKHTKFKSAWKAIEDSDPVKFGQLLKLSNFFKSSEKDYIKAELAYLATFMSKDYYEIAVAKLPNNLKPTIELESLFEKIVQFLLRLFKWFI